MGVQFLMGVQFTLPQWVSQIFSKFKSRTLTFRLILL